jgi:hypothetical protein
MSAWPATKSSPAHAGTAYAMAKPTRWRPIRQGAVILAVGAALAVAACTGGAGLDIPIGPVDHSCPHGNSCGSGHSS